MSATRAPHHIMYAPSIYTRRPGVGISTANAIGIRVSLFRQYVMLSIAPSWMRNPLLVRTVQTMLLHPLSFAKDVLSHQPQDIFRR